MHVKSIVHNSIAMSPHDALNKTYTMGAFEPVSSVPEVKLFQKEHYGFNTLFWLPVKTLNWSQSYASAVKIYITTYR
jgi:hypothetical protein